jgi:hypothetical protein
MILLYSYVYCIPKNSNFHVNDLNVYFSNLWPLYHNREDANVYAFVFLLQAYLNNLNLSNFSRLFVLFACIRFQKLKCFVITSVLDTVNAKNTETAIKHH